MPHTKTVVHVEDDMDVADLLDVLFAGFDVNWINAATGAAGLELARELHPDLVVLDLLLPDIPGRDVFLEMQADPELKDIPVWVLSVISWNANRYPWQEPAVVSYTFKPFDIERFRDGVLNWLGLERGE
jgi:two-component system cell cycle response regulator DivK